MAATEPKVLKHYINGKFVDGATGAVLDVMNPLEDKVICRLPVATAEETALCVKTAHEAFLKWREVPVVNRIQPLFRFLEQLRTRSEDIARSVTENHGKEIVAARAEVLRAIQMVESSLCAPEYQKGEHIENIAPGVDEYTVRVPMGVFLCIPPFNFPAMVPFWFFPYAVAAGNSYIIKSNEQTPLSMQIVFECIDKSGFPPGVINYLHGDVSTALALIDSPHVMGVSSVGSTPVAKAIYSRASALGKRAQCHGGANNTLVVTSHAAVDDVIPNIINSCFGNAGQRCLAGSTILTVGNEAVYETFQGKFVAACKAMKIGSGFDESAALGPLVSKKSLQTLHVQIQRSVDAGAKLVLDGRGVKVPEFPHGYFLGPTLLENVTPATPCDLEEMFGPVVRLGHVATLDEAIARLNADPKGNATTIYTESGDEARKFKHAVAPGMVGVNIGLVAPLAWFPFSGMKDSFYGILRGQGRDAYNFTTQERVVIERYHGHHTILWD
jgi:malonate-semialdehyde dehydrogenase (acetylating)/methylmalonate-semialdehyde dehydrogenase